MNTHPYTIRPAAAEDAPSIVAMHHALAEYCGYAPNDIAITESIVAETIERRGSDRYIVAAGNSALQGMMYLGETPVSWKGTRGYYVEDLFVKPEYRGKAGVGRALLGRAASLAITLAGSPAKAFLRLDTSVNDNEPTLGFYRHLGFSEDNINMRLAGSALMHVATTPTDIRG